MVETLVTRNLCSFSESQEPNNDHEPVGWTGKLKVSSQISLNVKSLFFTFGSNSGNTANIRQIFGNNIGHWKNTALDIIS